MKDYKRLTERRNGIVIDKCANCENVRNPQGCTDKKCYEIMKNRLAELEEKIENGTLIEIVRCKDCIYFQPKYVEMENGKRRQYTEEEIKNGKFVSLEKGINCGSRCERYRYWDNNSIPVWFNENDFCSYGKLKAEAEKKLEELEND